LKWSVGAELAGAVMRQVLEDASMHLSQVRDVELALNRVQDELGLPCGG
jgi:hypothetical protein